MDKNGARGRAESLVQFMLNDGLKHGFFNMVLADRPSDEVAAVRQELQNIADEHAELAKFHKAVECGEPLGELRRDGKNKAGDTIQLRIDPQVKSEVLWDNMCGYFVTLEVETPEDARKLYEALLCVKEVEAD